MWNNDTGWNSRTEKVETVDWQAAYEESERLAKERWAQLPPIVKGFYEEHEDVKQLTDAEVEKFRQDNNNIVVSHFREGDPFILPKPAPRFEHSFHNHPDILKLIELQAFKTPSPIQSQSWPILLQGKDLIGIAQTGTGKTLAYLLPGLLSIVKQITPRPERPGPSVLIMAPTRELAQQIDREAKKYSYQDIQSLCVYGGGDRGGQIAQCKKKPEIIIATPGRLNDLTMNGVIDLSAVIYLVLDEADRMLDMGFMPQIRKVMCDVRPDRQTVMMSATWPPGVRKIATDFMKDPTQIFVGSLDLAAVNSVAQQIIMTDPDQKRKLLYDFILKTMTEKDKAIVFVGRKSVADDISSELALNDIACQCMHGDRDQADRERALADIKSGEVKLIIATDVASRGLDIDDITYILNYDFPSNAEEYVHRVGRTGRAGRTGKSITFFTRDDWRHAKELIDILSKSSAEIPQELEQMAERYQAWLDKKRTEDDAASAMGGGRRGGRGGFGGGGGGRNRHPRDGGSDSYSFSSGGSGFGHGRGTDHFGGGPERVQHDRGRHESSGGWTSSHRGGEGGSNQGWSSSGGASGSNQGWSSSSGNGSQNQGWSSSAGGGQNDGWGNSGGGGNSRGFRKYQQQKSSADSPQQTDWW